jgi:hypothetical protein
LPHRALLSNQAKPGPATFLPFASPLTAFASVKICHALPALLATFVLPDFGRSSSADGGGLILLDKMPIGLLETKKSRDF